MAWIYGNNPVGQSIVKAWFILPQIAYAINEREDLMGQTPTEWAWNGIGSFPTWANFAGQSVVSYRPLIEEMRTAIEDNLVTYTLPTGSTVYACDASWDQYASFALLYNAAMGAGFTWSVADLTNTRCDDATHLEELMKVLDLLVRWEVRPAPAKQGMYEDAGPEATSNAIQAAAIATGPTITTPAAGVTRGLQAEVSKLGANYIDWWQWAFHVWKFEAPYAAAGRVPDSVDLRIGYGIGSVANVEDCPWYLRTITLAEYNNPTWTSAGIMRDSQTFQLADVGYDVKTYNDPAWITPRAINYIRMDMGTTNPLDPGPGGTVQFALRDVTYSWRGMTLRYTFSGWASG